MANNNNSTSLYGFSTNTVVSTNNFTTLYSSKPGNIATGVVGDRNFTTLYTQQSDVRPTSAYGNSNVESFLNTGLDSGGNQVQNIVMYGNLNVGSQSNLGNVGNVHITGGNLNYILQTDGSGNLNWVSIPSTGGNVTNYIHFDVSNTGNNQTFTYANLSVYANSNVMAVFKNGINIEPSQYDISGNVLTINIPLSGGDTIDVLPSNNGGARPGGNLTEVQYNGGTDILSGNSSFTFDQANSLLTVGNINTSNINVSNINAIDLYVSNKSNLGANSNVIITGGNNLQVLSTDGLGNLSWVNQSGGGNVDANYANFAGNVVNSSQPNITSVGNLTQLTSNGLVNFINTSNVSLGNVGNVHITGGINNQFLRTNGNGLLTWANVSNGTSSNLFPNGISILNSSNIDVFSGNTVGSNAGAANINASFVVVRGDLGVYPISGFFVDAVSDSNGTARIDFIGNTSFNEAVNSGGIGKSVNLGNVNYLYISGGTSGQVLTTNGSGNLSWTSSIANANYAAYAGNVTIAGQSNITSVGTLTSLTVSGNIVTGNLSSTGLSNVANTKFTKFNETLIAGGSVSGTLTPDAAAGTIYTYTLTGNITLNSLGNAVAGTSMTIELTQDGTGGRTLTSTMKFAGGSKILSTAPNAVDIISLYYNGTNYYAVLSKGYS